MEQRGKTIENLEQELSRIRAEIERRKREADLSLGSEVKAETSEQMEKIISETLKSHIKENPPDVLREDYRLKQEEIKGHIENLLPEQDDRQIEALFELAITKGIINAVRVCENLKNPHLLDDLHRRLVHYFNFETDNK